MDRHFTPIKDGISRGRKLEFFHHSAVKEWGGREQMDAFAVIHPLRRRRRHGLYVVLHSAGHDLYSCLGCTFAPDNHDIYRAPDDMFGLYLDCRENADEDFWWGGINAKGEGKPERRIEMQPVEKRALATIEWVMANYPVDEERVYLCGNSMGGSGALGLGMCRGDLFAAVKVNVPAGVEHMLDRMTMAGENVPEPPVCIDYSAPNDTWSAGHDKFYKYMREHKYMLFGYWGTFGHANANSTILAKNDLVHTFDWLSLRRKQAYPVFTNAASDNPNPWEHPETAETSGQVNAFFRWRNLSDRKDSFAMKIFIDAGIKTSFQIPMQTSADVTMRRMQKFQLTPNEAVAWTFGGQQGVAKADGHGLLTLPKLLISRTENVLKLRKL